MVTSQESSPTRIWNIDVDVIHYVYADLITVPIAGRSDAPFQFPVVTFQVCGICPQVDSAIMQKSFKYCAVRQRHNGQRIVHDGILINSLNCQVTVVWARHPLGPELIKARFLG